MPEPITYEIELNGNVTEKLLRPLIDDFAISHPERRRTLLVGDVIDASHLHGIIAYLASVNIEIISMFRSRRHDETSEQ